MTTPEERAAWACGREEAKRLIKHEIRRMIAGRWGDPIPRGALESLRDWIDGAMEARA